MKAHLSLFNITVKFWIFVSVLVFLPFIAQACHDGCGGSLVCSCDSYGQGGYYEQSGYYGQSGYYSQSTYYVQATYYLQGGYWAEIDQAWVRATPQTARYGDSVEVTWSGGNADSCTLSGGGLTSTSTVGTTTIAEVTGEAVVTLSCNIGPNISLASTTIKVLPALRESYNTSSIFDFLKFQVANVIGWFQQ